METRRKQLPTRLGVRRGATASRARDGLLRQCEHVSAGVATGSQPESEGGAAIKPENLYYRIPIFSLTNRWDNGLLSF